MQSLDALIVIINALVIIVIYKSIIRFWSYRLRKQLINEGFIDEKNLEKLFQWNKVKELVNLLKLGVFAGVIGLGFLIYGWVNDSVITADILLLLGFILLLIGAASFVSYYLVKSKF
jgi:hypothetical protein